MRRGEGAELFSAAPRQRYQRMRECLPGVGCWAVFRPPACVLLLLAGLAKTAGASVASCILIWFASCSSSSVGSPVSDSI